MPSDNIYTIVRRLYQVILLMVSSWFSRFAIAFVFAVIYNGDGVVVILLLKIPVASVLSLKWFIRYQIVIIIMILCLNWWRLSYFLKLNSQPGKDLVSCQTKVLTIGFCFCRSRLV